ncbi:hypothetical protein TPELB_21040 [Terrisporobacter petrolearius]|uniref:Lipoprotein n=1 Tax=Terrisporobacter petrolearius TaxID=1460447 RepID=A0ABZ3FF06_9FIRM|nr:hypothetical protein SAMN02910355_1401 [Terrisporobacter glycolicus]
MITKIAVIISAITTITGVIITVFKLMCKLDKMNNNINKIPAIKNDVDNIKNELKNNSLDTYRLAIINDKMPIDERLAAGDRYIKLGGNGAIHLYLEELKEKHNKEVYEKLK